MCRWHILQYAILEYHLCEDKRKKADDDFLGAADVDAITDDYFVDLLLFFIKTASFSIRSENVKAK